jgi:hypothetical protein
MHGCLVMNGYAVIEFTPHLRRGHLNWCVKIDGMIDMESFTFCSSGLEPNLLDVFFQYRQALLRYVRREVNTIIIGRGRNKRVSNKIRILISRDSWPLPAHILLGLIAATTLRSPDKKRKVLECFARLDPLEPITPYLYDIVGTVVNKSNILSYKHLSRLSRCLRCWCT